MKYATSVKRICLYALLAAILCVVSPLAVPIGPVPISFSVMGVLLCSAMLGVRAIVPVGIYLAIGALGLPVFAGGMGGFGVLVGPTGGFLWSYPVVAVLTGCLYRISLHNWKGGGHGFLHIALGSIPGMVICYVCGSIQYMLVASTSLMQSFLVCVAPFLLFDIAKIVLLCLITVRLLVIPSVRMTVTSL